MGYYTSFELSYSEVFNPKIDDAIVKEIEKMNVFEGNHKYVYWANCKWYEYQYDMAKLSKKFPDVLFELHGQGDDSEDMWNCYFKDGGVQFCPAEITYADFDPKALKYNIKDFSEPYSYGCPEDEEE